MAAVVTQTNTLNIVIGESSLQGVGQEITWKLDNPVANLTYASVNSAWSNMAVQILPCDASGVSMPYLKKASTVLTVKTTEELV